MYVGRGDYRFLDIFLSVIKKLNYFKRDYLRLYALRIVIILLEIWFLCMVKNKKNMWKVSFLTMKDFHVTIEEYFITKLNERNKFKKTSFDWIDFEPLNYFCGLHWCLQLPPCLLVQKAQIAQQRNRYYELRFRVNWFLRTA